MSIDSHSESDEWEFSEDYRNFYNDEKRKRWRKLRADNRKLREMVSVYKEKIEKLLEERNERKVLSDQKAASSLQLHKKVCERQARGLSEWLCGQADEF